MEWTYILNRAIPQASMKLKTDGNYLVGTGNHKEASEKYIRLSCQMNLALCQLKTGENSACISTCTDVLKNDPASLKATYRRGQAYQAK
eukprot:951391-Pyramimonas_sp.AAC.1